jgi:hypothetical protein
MGHMDESVPINTLNLPIPKITHKPLIKKIAGRKKGNRK